MNNLIAEIWKVFAGRKTLLASAGGAATVGAFFFEAIGFEQFVALSFLALFAALGSLRDSIARIEAGGQK